MGWLGLNFLGWRDACLADGKKRFCVSFLFYSLLFLSFFPSTAALTSVALESLLCLCPALAITRVAGLLYCLGDCLLKEEAGGDADGLGRPALARALGAL